MTKSITLILILLFTILKSYSSGSDSCFIQLNKKYILKNDSLNVSLTFINDSTYILRGEKATDRWVSYGEWNRLSGSTILMIPNKGGVKLKPKYKSKTWGVDAANTFAFHDEKLEIKCIKGKANLRVRSYVFK